MARAGARGRAADLSMPFPVPLEELALVVPTFNANRLVNAIRYVYASAPGILTTEELPHPGSRPTCR
jgi:hypothetical protein